MHTEEGLCQTRTLRTQGPALCYTRQRIASSGGTFSSPRFTCAAQLGVLPLKNCKLVAIFILLLGAVSGCSSIGPGRTVLTGTKREPIPAEQVKIYQAAPLEAQEVAMIMSEANGKGQSTVHKAIVRLKARAASLGANGVILRGINVNKGYVTYYGMPVAPGKSETGISATAIHVSRVRAPSNRVPVPLLALFFY